MFRFHPRCRVLVGINESGKSNILRALSLLDPDIAIEPDDLRDSRPQDPPYISASIRFYFTIDADEKAAATKAIAQRIEGKLSETPIIQINGKHLSISQYVQTFTEVLYRVNLFDKSRDYSFWAPSANSKILPPWQYIQQHAVTAPPGTQIRPAPAKLREQPREILASEKLLEFTPVDLARMVAQEFHAMLKKQHPSVVVWKYSESQLLPGKINLAAFSEDPDICLPLKHMFNLAGVEDIGEAIEAATERKNGIRNLLKKVSAVATKHLHQVWKEYRAIDFEIIQNGDHIDAHIIDRYNAFDLSRRSDGFKRFVSFLFHISAKAKSKHLKNTLYLDDEPDIGLHPSGARYLRDELVKVAEENFVVYATHSIFMIDGENLDRHLLVSKTNETTAVEQASDSNFANEEVMFNALGYSIFEHLKPVNIVFEGWRDKRLFKVALTGTSTEWKTVRQSLADVGVCYAHGVKDVGRITAMLELARRNGIVISDADKPAREKQKLYKGDAKWLRYDELLSSCEAVTGEDFILYSAFRPVLQQLAKEDSRLGSVPDESQFIGKGNLRVIAKWLEGAGISQEDVKERLERIKEDVFTNLKPAMIGPGYWDLLSALSAVLPDKGKEMNGPTR